MAKNSLERYTHYYERWASNQTVCIMLTLLMSEDVSRSSLLISLFG
jgi:hypothetical protein